MEFFCNGWRESVKYCVVSVKTWLLGFHHQFGSGTRGQPQNAQAVTLFCTPQVARDLKAMFNKGGEQVWHDFVICSCMQDILCISW